MLKRIALFGVFFFASAIATAAVTTPQPQKKASTAQPAPTSPQPKGICVPVGNRC